MTQACVVIGIIVAALCACPSYAKVSMTPAEMPGDSSMTSNAKKDSLRTISPPPTFRIEGSLGKDSDAGTTRPPNIQKPRSIVPGTVITCLSFSFGIGSDFFFGPEVVVTRNTSRHFAAGFIAGLGISPDKPSIGLIGLHLRVYPVPEQLLFYSFSDLGVEFNIGEPEGHDPTSAPIGRLGIGSMSKSGGQVDVFIEGGGQAAMILGRRQHNTGNEFRPAVFCRAGLVF